MVTLLFKCAHDGKVKPQIKYGTVGRLPASESASASTDATDQTLNGTTGDDTYRGHGGNDTINLSSGGSDTVIFEATAAANGTDSISSFIFGAAGSGSTGDVLNFGAFLGTSGSVADADSQATGIQAFASNATETYSINGKVALVTGTVTDVTALFGNSKIFLSVGDDGKAVVLVATTADAATAY
jgi:hypothetical protein